MRTIIEALAPYEAGRKSSHPRMRQYNPACTLTDDCGRQAMWIVVYPGEAPNLFLCEPHYLEWLDFADHYGTLGCEFVAPECA
jgi:hypothetical protein